MNKHLFVSSLMFCAFAAANTAHASGFTCTDMNKQLSVTIENQISNDGADTVTGSVTFARVDGGEHVASLANLSLDTANDGYSYALELSQDNLAAQDLDATLWEGSASLRDIKSVNIDLDASPRHPQDPSSGYLKITTAAGDEQVEELECEGQL